MLNHVMVGSNNIAKSKEFYDAVLGVLGARPAMEHTNSTGQKRLFFFHNGSTFAISEPINGQPPSSANGSTIGFACNSPRIGSRISRCSHFKWRKKYRGRSRAQGRQRPWGPIFVLFLRSRWP